jgi:hypothetical protein
MKRAIIKILLCVALFILPVAAFGAGEAGKVEIVIHVAQNLEDKMMDWERLMLFDPVMGGSLVRTLKDSKLKLSLVDGTYLLLTEDSKLRVEDVKPKGKSFLKMFSGKLRAVVKKAVGKDTKLEVQTPTAVVGVKGTDFLVLLSKDVTEIIVYEGVVNVSNVLKSIAGQVEVRANYYTKVTRFAPPTEPVELSSDQKTKIVKKFGLSEELFNQEVEKIKKKDPKEEPTEKVEKEPTKPGDIEGTVEPEEETPTDVPEEPGDLGDGTDFTGEIVDEPVIEDVNTGIGEPPPPPTRNY